MRSAPDQHHLSNISERMGSVRSVLTINPAETGLGITRVNSDNLGDPQIRQIINSAETRLGTARVNSDSF